MFKRYCCFLLSIICFSTYSKTDVDFEMSMLSENNGLSTIQAHTLQNKQPTAQEKFIDSNPDLYVSLLSSDKLLKAVSYNMPIFEKDAHREQLSLGYLQLGGVDFDLMYRNFAKVKQSIDYSVKMLDEYDNQSICYSAECMIKKYYKSGAEWGKYTMINFWIKNEDNSKKMREKFVSISVDRIGLNYLQYKTTPSFLKTFYNNIFYKGFLCKKDENCLNQITGVDIYSKLILICMNKIIKTDENEIFKIRGAIFQKCLVSMINKDYEIKKQIAYEGFIESYTKFLRIDENRGF